MLDSKNSGGMPKIEMLSIFHTPSIVWVCPIVPVVIVG
jgi:hypothetical protein